MGEEADVLPALRAAIARLREAPASQEARRRLRMVASRQGVADVVIAVLAEQVPAALCDHPAIAAAMLEELARAYDALDRPIEAIAALEQLVALAPENVEHLEQLARRYADAGAWPKAAEAFERVGALAPRDRACGALHVAAKLYRANARPDRAVEAYRAIVAKRAGDKEAWRELEQLLEELERWRDVADVRGELAKRAPTAVDKATMLRAQARAVERAGDASGAAELMAAAARYAPDQVSGLLDFADVLARQGKGREAAELLGKRIGEAVARKAPADEIAGLRAHQAALLEDACGDRPAAAAVLATLLADDPTYLPALERLVWHAAHDPDPRVHAAALVRYAAALDDAGAKANALVDAARRYRDARDFDAATRAFGHAIELGLDDPALRAELEDARAAFAVERAAADATTGDLAGAERRIREILAARPFDARANLALAEILLAARDPGAAREHLQRTLASAPDDMPRAQLAPLAHKHALVVAATGDADEAHRLLHEAHLFDRSSLAITLALGQSCFARRLWREAARCLAGLAEHPDAPRHAPEVARGLVQAGQAEIRALRPANALKHYEAAVQLDPECAPAWHALAAVAMERDDIPRAVDCFEREAAATRSPADRVRLFDALGDLAHDVMHDPARAEHYWSQAAGGREQLAPAGSSLGGQPAILGKLLAVQRARGAGVERAETCLRLAELDSEQHQVLVAEAAEALAAAGDFVRARAAAERLIAAHPLDVDAVNIATKVVLAGCDADTAAAWLSRALAAWDKAKARDPRHVELWQRLGDAERSRNRPNEARIAYERAIGLDAKSRGALAARRGLIELAPKSDRRSSESLEVVVEAEQSAAEVLALARRFVAADRTDEARATFDLARALGAALTADDDQFLARTAVKPMAYDEAYASSLSEAVRRDLVDDPADEPIGELLGVLGEALAHVAPDPATALRAAGLADAKRLSVSSFAAASALYPKIANALGGSMTLLFAHGSDDEMRVVLASPPVIVLGKPLAEIQGTKPDPAIEPALRFKLGRAVELARPSRVFAAGSDAAGFRRRIDALASAFGTIANPAVADDAARLRSAVPISLRKRIADLLATTTALDADAYRAGCIRAADRSGLVACGNATVAIELAGGVAAAPHLVQLAASRRYRAARRELRSRNRS